MIIGFIIIKDASRSASHGDDWMIVHRYLIVFMVYRSKELRDLDDCLQW